jgi:hypothetical protein
MVAWVISASFFFLLFALFGWLVEHFGKTLLSEGGVTAVRVLLWISLGYVALVFLSFIFRIAVTVIRRL